MSLLLIAVGTLVAIYIAVIYFFPNLIPGQRSRRTQDALDQIVEESNYEDFNLSDGNILKEKFEAENDLVRGVFSLPVLDSIYPLIVKAGMQKDASSVILMMVGLLFGSSGLLFYFGLGIVSVLFAPFLAFFLTRFYLKRKIQKRNDAFIDLFPDVLDMFVRCIRSGFPVSAAFKMVAENMEAPVGPEFEQIVQELSLGRTVSESLTRLSQRIDEQDIRFFVVVIKVQQETGGNLSEIVSNLSNVIRKRKQLRMKIKAMTSEGRATAYILGALPVAIFAILYVMRKEYLEPLWTTPLGMTLFGTSIGLIVLCMFIINQMIKIDI